jgi:shikimate kinase
VERVVSYTNVVQKIAPTAQTGSYDTARKVASIRIKAIMKNATGELFLTDLMLQSGSIATGWTGHPSEIQFTTDG